MKAILTFARMNPITSGHELLIRKLVSESKKLKATPFVFLSQTHDKKKNPLTYDQKITYAKKFFKDVTIPKENTIKTIIHALKWLNTKGYTDFVVMVGSDRVTDFEKFGKYAGKDFEAASYKVISAGERDPDSEGVDGMSASKLRGFVKTGDFNSFSKGLPSKANISDARKLFNIINDTLNEDIDELFSQLLGEENES